MASSGAFSGGGGYQGRTLEFHWYETGSSIQNNTRTIHWELRVVGGSSSYYYHYHEHLYIDGVEVYANDTRTKRYTGVITSGDRSFTHDASGNKTFSVRIYSAIYTSNYNVDNTNYFSLDNIARQANITNSIVSFNDEENPWFDYSNPGNWSCKAWLEPNPGGLHYAERTVTGTGGRYTWSLTDSERKQLRQACKSNNCTIRIGLYSNGTTWASYHDRTYIIKNPMPITEIPTWKSTNLADLGDTATVIKGFSNIAVVIPTATAVKEAIITQYKVVCGTVEITSTTPGTLSLEKVDASTIHVYITDSRSNVVEKILNITKFIQYEKPTITLLDFERGEGGIGTQVDMTYKGTMWVGSFGKLSNTVTAQYFYKEQGASTWATGVTVVNPTVATSFSKTTNIQGDLAALGFSVGKNYDFKIVITDRVAGSVEKVGILASGVPTIAYHPDGFCVGGFYNESEGGALQLFGVNIVNYFLPVGTQIYNARKDFNPNTLYKGTVWKRIKGVVLAGINEEDKETTEYLKFSHPSGTILGASYQDLRAWIGAYDANTSKFGYNAKDKVPGEVFTYGFDHGWAEANVGNDRIAHTTMVTNTTGQQKVSVIQPTKLTYVWERTA